MSVYIVVVGICWIALFVAWLILAIAFGGSGTRYYAGRASGFRILLFLAIFVGLRYGGRASLQSSGNLEIGLAGIGAAICVAGVAFAIWARVVLGRNWGMPMTVHENPELVTSGPYAYVRHPIYTGLTGMLIGTSLANPFAAIPCGLVIAYSVFSALREERDMEKRFPEAYSEYKKRSKMFVPFLI